MVVILGGCYWRPVGRGEARAVAEHPAVHRTDPQQRIVQPHIPMALRLRNPVLLRPQQTLLLTIDFCCEVPPCGKSQKCNYCPGRSFTANSVNPLTNPLVKLSFVLRPQVAKAAKSPWSTGPGTGSPGWIDIPCSLETRR